MSELDLDFDPEGMHFAGAAAVVCLELVESAVGSRALGEVCSSDRS